MGSISVKLRVEMMWLAKMHLKVLCSAVSDVFSQQAAHMITVYILCLFPTGLPAIVDLPAPVNHTEGTRFVLVCTFTGVPTPNVRWEKDGSVFLLGGGRSIVNSTGRSQLVINSLALSDAGVYTCSVTNMAGTATNSVQLEVEEGQLEVSMLLISNLNVFLSYPRAHAYEFTLLTGTSISPSKLPHVDVAYRIAHST